MFKVNTPIGFLEIEHNGSAITRAEFVDESAFDGANGDFEHDIAAAFAAFFRGELKDFELPLEPAGTPFQRKVWDALQRIPYGRTVSYADLSQELGDPKAIRAVADGFTEQFSVPLHEYTNVSKGRCQSLA